MLNNQTYYYDYLNNLSIIEKGKKVIISLCCRKYKIVNKAKSDAPKNGEQ